MTDSSPCTEVAQLINRFNALKEYLSKRYCHVVWSCDLSELPKRAERSLRLSVEYNLDALILTISQLRALGAIDQVKLTHNQVRYLKEHCARAGHGPTCPSWIDEL